MKILIYGINYAPEPIGIGKYTGEMVEWLAARGHDVDVITAVPHYPFWKIPSNYSGAAYYVEQINGARVMRSRISMPLKKKISALDRIKLETSFTWHSLHFWLPVWKSKKLYDVVVAVCPPLQTGIYPLIYQKLSKTPWVFHVQDLQVDAAVRLGMLGGGFGKIIYSAESLLLRNATNVSTITHAMKQRIVEKGTPEDKVFVFPNWTDLALVKPSAKDNRYRREMKISLDQTLFMYSGNLGEKQGLELVVDAAARLQSQTHIQFAICGDGASSARLKNLARQKNLMNVHFLPLQPVESLSELLAAADIHLIIQKREAADIVMPSKLTNILAAGRPVLATAEVGTTLYDVLTTNKLGMLTPPEDLGAFAIMVKMLAENKSLREQMGTDARAYAERTLSKDTILLEFETKLESLVSRT